MSGLPAFAWVIKVNFLQLVNRLMVEAGASGSALSTTVNQTGEAARMVNWTNSAWLDIQSTKENWDWMRTTVTFPTVTSQPIYTLSQIGISATYGNWVRESFRNYANPLVTLTNGTPGTVTLQFHLLSVGDQVTFFTDGALPTGLIAGTAYYVQSIVDANDFTVSATNGGAAIAFTGTQSGDQSMSSNNTTTFAGFKSEIFMDELLYDEWRDSYDYGALRQVQTRPVSIAIAPNKALCVGPFPIGGYTVLGDYFTVPSYMALDTDTPALPVQYHEAIVYRALMFYGMYESAPEAATRGQQEFARLMARIGASRMPEFTFSGALA